MKRVVTAVLEGERADKAVAVLAEVSRSVARRLIESGAVTVGGSVIGVRDHLPAGTEIDIVLPEPEVLRPEPVSFDVVYEDADVAVVDKPAGVIVHPGAGARTGTLAAGLLHRWPSIEGVGVADRWGLVHRLDRETSGLLIVALTPSSYETLSDAIARRTVTRRYQALVHGHFELPSGTIDAPIGRDRRRPVRQAVRRDGRPARTHYRVVSEWEKPSVSLLAITLETGRTHQIRVHLSSIGHPVVGDRTYGGAGPEDADPGRVWLHADELEFTHPTNGEEMRVSSPLPPDLRASLERLGPPTVR